MVARAVEPRAHISCECQRRHRHSRRTCAQRSVRGYTSGGRTGICVRASPRCIAARAHTIQTHTHTRARTHTDTHTHVCARTHTHARTHARARARSLTHSLTHSHTHRDTHTHTHARARARAHTHTHRTPVCAHTLTRVADRMCICARGPVRACARARARTCAHTSGWGTGGRVGVGGGVGCVAAVAVPWLVTGWQG